MQSKILQGLREDVRKNGHTPGNNNKYTYMYAIVEIGGQQFKAEAGKFLFVHHIKDAEEGKSIEFDKVLLANNDGAVTVGSPVVEGAKVVGEVTRPIVKGKKVIVFHTKRRKDERKKNGHREQFTEIKIKEVIA